MEHHILSGPWHVSCVILRSCPLRHYDLCLSHEETGQSGNLPTEVGWPTERLSEAPRGDTEILRYTVYLDSKCYWTLGYLYDSQTSPLLEVLFGEMDGHVCNALESIRVPCNSTSGVLKLGFIKTLIMDEKMCSIAHFWKEDFHQILVEYKIQKWFGTVL